MEAKLFVHTKSLLINIPRSHTHAHMASKRYRIYAVLGTRPSNSYMPTDTPDLKIQPVNKKADSYDDNWFEKMAIDHLSRSLQAAIGVRSRKNGYDGLVEAAETAASNFELEQQHELVLHSLERAFPSSILSLIRILLPQTKLTRELFAVFTRIFFAWLVGPSEVRETELNGRREKSIVYIQKCRFLEQTNCVGMCNHLCKIPSQTFIKNSLGMPVYMNPNFDDTSCEIIFGQDPPQLTDDPALKQPCYNLCKSNKKYGMKH